MGPVPFLDGGLFDAAEEFDARVVDQDVQAAEFVFHLFQHGAHGVRIGDIGVRELAAAAEFGDGPGGGFSTLFVDVADDDVRAGAGQNPGYAGADSRGGSCHQRDSVL